MISIENWFPTQIALVNASSVLCGARDKFSSVNFEQYSNELYQFGYTSFFNDPTEYAKDSDLAKLHSMICESTEQLAQQQGVDTAIYKCVVIDMWLNRMGVGAAHEKHVHPSSHYSGTMYVNGDEGSGAIRFHSPVGMMWRYCPLPVAEDGNCMTCIYVTHDPTPGKMLIWNSWLEHEVMPNNSTVPRDSISFNVRLEKRA